MLTNAPTPSSLIEVTDSVLVVIDIQDCFLNKFDNAKVEALLSKVGWLIKAAGHLDVPILAMAEDIANAGGLNEQIATALPEGTTVHDKNFFGLSANPEIFTALQKMGRGTAICVGTETDVCVAQTAIGLVDNGYRVVALQDAVATTDADEAIGIDRMRGAGVIISSVKALYYEWVRSVSGCRKLDNVAPDLKAARPASLIL
ncbi:MAG: isochorismatase family protein [Gammaproteobacteria bacterium]|nr:isochorismatase family protein [Gammaproteobacteria bacterium]